MKKITQVADSAAYLAALSGQNIAAGLVRRGAAVMSMVMMFANNILFFVIWLVYFANFSSLRGWQLADLALIMGAGTWGFGVMVVALGGVREIARAVDDGSLDVHLGRPRHPLPSLILSRSVVSGWGDMASAFVFWFWFGDLALAQLPFILVVATAGGLVFAAAVVTVQSLAFWITRASALGDDFLNVMVTVSIYPQNIYGMMVRAALYSVFPAAFITYVPVMAVREGSWTKGVLVIVAAAVYAAIAAWVFTRGLRRYASGNRMIEIR